MNICLFRNGSVLVRISLVPYKYVPIYMCIVKDTYFIRIRIYAQQLKYMKIRRKMKKKFVVFYLQFINSLKGLGMFFSSAALISRLRRYAATTGSFQCPFLQLEKCYWNFQPLLMTIHPHVTQNRTNCVNKGVSGIFSFTSTVRFCFSNNIFGKNDFSS